MYAIPQQTEREQNPTVSYVQPGERSKRARLIDIVERMSGRTSIDTIYQQVKSEGLAPQAFFARALELADISYSVSGAPETAIPSDGPLVIVANHPFGVVDGLILCDIASRLRVDFRILINALLCRDDDLAPFFLPIDFRETREASKITIHSKQQAKATLAEGGAILLFPAGAITTRSHKGFGPLEEQPWSTFTAKLIAQCRATVVPLFFHGSNSRLFHMASGAHEALRASLLLNEARNKLGRNIRVHLGEPLEYSRLEHLDRPALTRFLQDHTQALGERR